MSRVTDEFDSVEEVSQQEEVESQVEQEEEEVQEDSEGEHLGLFSASPSPSSSGTAPLR